MRHEKTDRPVDLERVVLVGLEGLVNPEAMILAELTRPLSKGVDKLNVFWVEL